MEEIVREEDKFKAMIMLKRSDDSRYKNLMSDLKSGAHLGRDEYPKSVAAAHDLMNRSSGQMEKHNSNSNTNIISGGSFLQTGSADRDGSNDPVPGTDGRLLPNIQCYNCENKGHYSGQCPDPDRRERRGSSNT